MFECLGILGLGLEEAFPGFLSALLFSGVAEVAVLAATAIHAALRLPEVSAGYAISKAMPCRAYRGNAAIRRQLRLVRCQCGGVHGEDFVLLQLESSNVVRLLVQQLAEPIWNFLAATTNSDVGDAALRNVFE